jgi:hypothetical protein
MMECTAEQRSGSFLILPYEEQKKKKILASNRTNIASNPYFAHQHRASGGNHQNCSEVK